jgi:hypothetical protein
MDNLLQDTQAMEGLFLDAFRQNELRGDVDIIDESLKFASTTPLFGHGMSQSTHLGTTMLLYNLKVMYGMSNTCFSTILR